MFDWIYILMQKVGIFWIKAEGRDKIAKLIIYLLKLADALLSKLR